MLPLDPLNKGTCASSRLHKSFISETFCSCKIAHVYTCSIHHSPSLQATPPDYRPHPLATGHTHRSCLEMACPLRESTLKLLVGVGKMRKATTVLSELLLFR